MVGEYVFRMGSWATNNHLSWTVDGSSFHSAVYNCKLDIPEGFFFNTALGCSYTELLSWSQNAPFTQVLGESSCCHLQFAVPPCFPLWLSIFFFNREHPWQLHNTLEWRAVGALRWELPLEYLMWAASMEWRGNPAGSMFRQAFRRGSTNLGNRCTEWRNRISSLAVLQILMSRLGPTKRGCALSVQRHDSKYFLVYMTA